MVTLFQSSYQQLNKEFDENTLEKEIQTTLSAAISSQNIKNLKHSKDFGTVKLRNDQMTQYPSDNEQWDLPKPNRVVRVSFTKSERPDNHSNPARHFDSGLADKVSLRVITKKEDTTQTETVTVQRECQAGVGMASLR